MRSYNPVLGRWLQPDAGVEGGGRDYVYVGDDPIDEADGTGASGLCDVPLFGGVACGVGSLAHGAYQLVAGDDIATLKSQKASGVDKFLAVIDLSTNLLTFVPIGGEGIEAAKLVAKLAIKTGSRVAERQVSYEAALELVKTIGRRSVQEAASCITSCFPAGTFVATAHGEQPIQRLRVGERVLAEDPATGQVEAEPIEAVKHDPVSPLIAVALSDGSAITVTAEHPFWVDAGNLLSAPGWLPAGQLRPGDRLRTASGTAVLVMGLRRGVGQAAVYTLTVAKDHTFFVGAAQVLVHNCIDFSTIKGRVERVLKGKEPRSSLTPEEREAAAEFYRQVADRTTGRYAKEARLYNLARAEYLEGTRSSLPPTLPDFIREELGGS